MGLHKFINRKTSALLNLILSAAVLSHFHVMHIVLLFYRNIVFAVRTAFQGAKWDKIKV